MVGLVIATHGRLADELVATAEQIVGKLPQVAACNVDPCAAPADVRRRLSEVVDSVDRGQGVIVLADLFGGTPCKEGLMLCGQRDLEVIAGVSLPMILKAHTLRTSEFMALPELAHAVAAQTQKTITCASDLLRDAHQPRGH